MLRFKNLSYHKHKHNIQHPTKRHNTWMQKYTVNPPPNNLYTCYCLVAQLCPTLCDPMDYSTPGFLSFTISLSLLKLMSIEFRMPSNYLIFCCPGDFPGKNTGMGWTHVSCICRWILYCWATREALRRAGKAFNLAILTGCSIRHVTDGLTSGCINCYLSVGAAEWKDCSRSMNWVPQDEGFSNSLSLHSGYNTEKLSILRTHKRGQSLNC